MKLFSRKRKSKNVSVSRNEPIERKLWQDGGQSESIQTGDSNQNENLGTIGGSESAFTDPDINTDHLQRSRGSVHRPQTPDANLQAQLSAYLEGAEPSPDQVSNTLESPGPAELEGDSIQTTMLTRGTLKLRQSTPKDIYRLRELIRTRYQLDVKIWELRAGRAADKPFVFELMRRADTTLQEIYHVIADWELSDWSPEEWELVQAIKSRLHKDGKRLWENNPPWHDTYQASTLTTLDDESKTTKDLPDTRRMPNSQADGAALDDLVSKSSTSLPSGSELATTTEKSMSEETVSGRVLLDRSSVGGTIQRTSYSDLPSVPGAEQSAKQPNNGSLQRLGRLTAKEATSKIRVSAHDIDPQSLEHFSISWLWAENSTDYIDILDNVSTTRLAELRAYSKALQELEKDKSPVVEHGDTELDNHHTPPGTGNSLETDSAGQTEHTDMSSREDESRNRAQEDGTSGVPKLNESDVVMSNEKEAQPQRIFETMSTGAPLGSTIFEVNRSHKAPQVNIVHVHGRREPSRQAYVGSDPRNSMDRSDKNLDDTHRSTQTPNDIRTEPTEEWHSTTGPKSREWQNTRHLVDYLKTAKATAKLLVKIVDSMPASDLLSSSNAIDCVERAEMSSETLYDYSNSEGVHLDDKLLDNLNHTRKRLKAALMKHHFAIVKAREEADRVEDTEQQLKKSPQLAQAHVKSSSRLKKAHNMQRVHWTCTCGARLFDDYIERVPGSLSNLQQRLELENWSFSSSAWLGYWVDLIKEAFTSLSPGNNITQSGTNVVNMSPIASIQQTSSMASSSGGNGNDLDDLNDGRSSLRTLTGTMDKMPEGTLSSVLYLLLCFPIGLSGLRLHHAQILLKQLRTDRQLFQLLRQSYGAEKENVTLSSRLSLRTVTRVSLSHFLVDLSQLVDLKPHSIVCDALSLGCRCLPPATMISPAPAAEYMCDPAEPDYMPPFGVNYLTHYFQNPSHLNPTSCWILRQVPKRMAGQLMAGPDAGFAKGWGLAFEEGWDRRRIGQRIFILVAFGALLFGILYAVLKKDVQSAFGVSGFVISVLAIVGGYLGTGEARGFIHE